jgi:hypothetical protein
MASSIYKIVLASIGSAPGGYKGILDMFSAQMSEAQMAQIVTDFHYGTTLTDAQWALALAKNIVGVTGQENEDELFASLADWILAEKAAGNAGAGYTRGETVVLFIGIMDYVVAELADDEEWGWLAQAWLNRLEVAEYLTESDAGKGSTDLSAFATLLLTVTEDPDSVTNAKDDINDGTIGDGVVGPTLTLTEALASEEPLAKAYAIDADSVHEGGTLDVEDAAALVDDAAAIVEGASNAAELELASVLTYSVADTLENLLAADADLLAGATAYSLTDETKALGLLTEEEATLVSDAANAEDYTFATYTITGAAKAEEGAAYTVTVALSAALATDLAVTFALKPGDAAAGNAGSGNANLNDFAQGAFNPSVLTIPAGQTSVTYTVTPLNDKLTELPEAFSVDVSFSSGSVTVAESLAVTLLDAGGSTIMGETFTLTVDQDDLTGTAGNDVFIAGAAQSDGVLTNTLQSIDRVDGGAGTDTLRATIVDNDGDTIKPVLTNIEIIEVRATSAETLDLGGSSGIEKIIVANSTEEFTIDGVGAVANFEFKNNTGEDDITINDVGATALNVVVSNIGSIANDSQPLIDFNDAGTVTSMTLSITNSSVEFDVDGDDVSVKTFSVAATGKNALDVSDGGFDDQVLTLTVTGSGSIDFDGGTEFSAVKTVDASANTGGVTDLEVGAAAVTVTLGSGNDEIIYDGAVAATAVVDLGAGDDELAVLANGITAGATIKGGAGTDTLSSAHAQWALIAAFSAANRAKITGFETLEISDTLADNDTVDLSKLTGLQSFVAADGVATTGEATVSGVQSGGFVTLAGDLSEDDGALIIEVDAGTDDALVNVTLNSSDLEDDNDIALTIEDVQTINLTATSTDDPEDIDSVYVLTLTADALVTLNIDGDQSVTFEAAPEMADLETINASDNTASVTIDVSGVSGVTITGTEGDDTFTLGNLSVVTGGEGEDTFTVTIPTNGNTYSTIVDLEEGETIQFEDQGDNGTGTALGAKLALAPTALFADYLNAAAAGDGDTDGIGTWFQFGGDTYLVLDRAAENTFQNGVDQLVKLTGLLDLSESEFSTEGLFTFGADIA